MSIGTFLDSTLFGLKCDFDNLAGTVSHLAAPVTPEFVFEKRLVDRSNVSKSLASNEPIDVMASRIFGETKPKTQDTKAVNPKTNNPNKETTLSS